LLGTDKMKVPMSEIPLFAEVALSENIPALGLVRGQVGAVVERLAPGAYEVEFSDDDGQAYEILTLKAAQLMRLHHKRAHEAA
jgi:hypothetical protein